MLTGQDHIHSMRDFQSKSICFQFNWTSVRSYFLHGSIFCLEIYMPVRKPSICFWKWVISIKWGNKLVIHNINLAGHRNSACCLQLLGFLEIWVNALFWHWKTQNFPKGCCHHDLKAFCETGYKSVLLNIIENMK